MILDILQNNFIMLLTVASVFGLMIGSFLNVVIYRLPLMLFSMWTKECNEFLQEQGKAASQDTKQSEKLNLAWPSSHCPQCKHKLGILENIPVLSYLIQRGKCKHCKARIPARYPIVELVCGLLTATVVAHFGLDWIAWLALILTWGLIALSFIDYDHQILPDNITLPLLWFGLMINASGVFTTAQDAIMGAIAGYLSFWLVYQLFKLVTGKEGMGHGDFKLLALLGAWLGWQIIPLVIILSSFVGAIVGIGMVVFKGHDKSKPIPFGPYIAFAGWISLLWGDIIVSKYFHYLGIQVTL